MENGSVLLGNTEMDYVSFGEGEKRLVVLPGLSDGLTTVKGKAWLLSLPYRKFFRDYTVSMEDMADDQASAMRSLGIGQACVLGVSQGGMIAQELAVRHPALVEKMILAVTAPNANETVKTVVSGWMELAERGDHTALMTDTAEKLYSGRYLQKYRKAFPYLAKLTKPSGYDRFLKNADAILRFDARREQSKISCPTLIIAGSDDRTVGTDAASELHSAIAGSELFIYEGLGHGAFEEAKDFYDRVLAFCSN